MAAPVAPQSNGKNFLQRELNGSTFLTLEHIGHMALVVLVPVLLLAGFGAAFSMWFGTPGMAYTLMGGASLLGPASMSMLTGALSLSVVAALLVLVPALVVLDRRTRAEWHKRPGFAGRLAYKVPVYTALAVLGALIVACKIQMIYVLIASLAFIGVQGAPIGSMYVNSFIPALLGLLVFGGAAWYVFTLAKGRDNGRRFSLIAAVLGAVVSAALFITTLVVLHDGKGYNGGVQIDRGSGREPAYDTEYYRDLLDKYYR